MKVRAVYSGRIPGEKHGSIWIAAAEWLPRVPISPPVAQYLVP
jgi:hypothetical protein